LAYDLLADSLLMMLIILMLMLYHGYCCNVFIACALWYY